MVSGSRSSREDEDRTGESPLRARGGRPLRSRPWWCRAAHAISPSTSARGQRPLIRVVVIRETIVRVHGRSSVGVVGLELKILPAARRLETPERAIGPATTTSRKRGSVGDQLVRRRRRSATSTKSRRADHVFARLVERRTNAAATNCCPALIGSGSVYIEIAPRPSAAPEGSVS